MYEIEITKRVQKFLKKRDSRFLERFYNQLNILISNPVNNNLDVKNIIGKKDCYRLRIGKYRILFEVKEKEILLFFYNANSRGDIY